MKTLTIVSPAYNEAQGIKSFYEALSAELKTLEGYDSDMLFVVDGGTDDTFKILKSISETDSKVRIVKLSTNFGHQMALLAGIDHAHADAIITMDSDLQHPPRVIKELLAEFEKGNDIVYTVRAKSRDVGMVRATLGSLFYWGVNKISDVPINENASDFRLISGRVADIIRTRIRERNLFLRGIVSWMGFKQAKVAFTADPRFAGSSKYNLGRLVQFALFGIISFSKKPLRAATILGLLSALFGFVFAVVTIIQYFLGQIAATGFSTIVVLITFFGGVQLIFLGVIGEYIGGIFDEVKGRPHYLVEDTVGVRATESEG